MLMSVVMIMIVIMSMIMFVVMVVVMVVVMMMLMFKGFFPAGSSILFGGFHEENVWPMVQAGKGISEMLLGSEDL